MNGILHKIREQREEYLNNKIREFSKDWIYNKQTLQREHFSINIHREYDHH
jgi:hypothetical protein